MKRSTDVDIVITIDRPAYIEIEDRARKREIGLPWYLLYLLESGFRNDKVSHVTTQEIRESLGICAGHYDIEKKKT